MRFSTALFAFVAAVSAQTGTTTSEAAPAETTLTSVQIECLKNCDDSDVNCRANCVMVPNPNDAQVNATTACVAACPQGNGTEAETQAYIDCSQDCVNQFYYNVVSGTPASGTQGSSASGSAASATASGSSGSSSSSGSSGSASGTGSSSSSSTSGSGSSATGTSSGANILTISSGLGLLGVFAAALAL
ncbi:hypothetical protein CFO_g3143 [Ceratocystis platani]|uniref:Uncharacterized protein n=1 Tax=Ceratocystis fimbriata f. sp. platani TaxID=88771 RepID=A0A0F8B0L7_CERFI|nr:hypothetical protein CFO_g3143 [Ceratocystis platani]